MAILSAFFASLFDKTLAASLEAPRVHHAAVHTPDSIQVTGGYRDTGIRTLKLPSAALQVRQDLSILSLDARHPTAPVAGHSLHWFLSSLLCLFGVQHDGKPAPPLAVDARPVGNSSAGVIPPPRYQHTAVVLDDAIYLVGGTSPDEEALVHADIWKLSWPAHTWTKMARLDHGLSGHTTVVYHHRLLSCFGATDRRGSFDACTWFDTHTLQSIIIDARPGWPAPRLGATLTPLAPQNSTHAVLFGGRTVNADSLGKESVLGDLWLLDLSTPQLAWTQLASNSPRTGHAATPINDTLLMFHNGQSSPDTAATTSLFLDTDHLTWTQKDAQPRIYKRSVDHSHAPDTYKSKGLSAGAIAGIVVAVLICVAIAVIVLFRMRSLRRRQLTQSRAKRFSLSPSLPRRESASMQSRHFSFASSHASSRGVTSWPPVAAMPSRPETVYSRSTYPSMSFGSDFHLPPLDTVMGGLSSGPPGPPRLEVTASQPEVLRSTSDTGSSSQTTMAAGNIPSKNSRSIKRFTFSLFSARQCHQATQSDVALPSQIAPASPKRSTILGLNTLSGDSDASTPMSSDAEANPRRSSLFGLRGSRLLQLPPLPRPVLTTNAEQRQSHASLGEKSVASVQWVEFNHDMDYKGYWRSSAYNLCVANPRRSVTTASSSCRTSIAASSVQTTPRSATFGHPHRFQSNDALSWESNPKACLRAQQLESLRNSTASTLSSPSLPPI